MSEEQSIWYDLEGYTKSLDKLVTMAEKEYYANLVDINRHQVNVARTLLWLAIVTLGFDISFIEWSFEKAKNFHKVVPFLTGCYIFVCLSALCNLISFGFAVCAIPAFGGYAPLYKKSWSEYAQPAFEKLHAGEDSIFATTLNEILTTVDATCIKGSETNASRGLKLRISSIFSVIAIALVFIGLLVFSINYYL